MYVIVVRLEVVYPAICFGDTFNYITPRTLDGLGAFRGLPSYLRAIDSASPPCSLEDHHMLDRKFFGSAVPVDNRKVPSLNAM
jgi:hypothetical protein